MSERYGIPLDDLPRRQWPGLLLSVAVVLLVAGVGLWAWFRGFANTGYVPDLLGRTRAEVVTVASMHNWEIAEILIRSPGTAPGKVVKIEPAPGTRLASEETLTVFVSLGEPLIEAPDLYALSVEEATSAVEEVGLIVADLISIDHEEIPDGFTVSVDLPVGVYEVEVGTKVNLLVSSGPADVVVPVLSEELTISAAQQLLGAARLIPVIDEKFSREVPEGQIIALDPPGGTLVPPDSVVTVEVSQGASQVQVPNLVGRELDEAASLLQDVGFNVITDGSDGPVRSISPQPGEMLPYGAEVVVSSDE